MTGLRDLWSILDELEQHVIEGGPEHTDQRELALLSLGSVLALVVRTGVRLDDLDRLKPLFKPTDIRRPDAHHVRTLGDDMLDVISQVRDRVLLNADASYQAVLGKRLDAAMHALAYQEGVECIRLYSELKALLR
jgi:hypothetical protein